MKDIPEMDSSYKFQGWLGLDADSVNGNMVWRDFEPKPFLPSDIDVKVTHCGVCGSDIHHLRSGWRPADYPLCVGHEIVGKVVRTGSKVTKIKVGDRVGIGAWCWACDNEAGDCDACADGCDISTICLARLANRNLKAWNNIAPSIP